MPRAAPDTTNAEAGPAPEQALELYTMPGHLIRRMHQSSVAIFETETRAAGFDLTPVQYAALAMVEAHPGLDQATLAGAIAFDRVTIGGVIDRLEKKGLLRREISKADRRARNLYLEPAGRKVLAGIAPAVRKAQAVMLQGLSESESRTLLRLLDKSLAAVGDLSRAPLRPVAKTA